MPLVVVVAAEKDADRRAMLGMLRGGALGLRVPMRSSLRLSSVSRVALVSASSLLNLNLLEVRKPLTAGNPVSKEKQTSMLATLLAAGVAAAVLLPICEPSDCMGKKRKKDSVLEDDMYEVASGRPEGLPHLAKMARQFLGRPATSAGVERMFSKAGKLHDDMKKGQEDDTLEHSLFAAANTE